MIKITAKCECGVEEEFIGVTVGEVMNQIEKARWENSSEVYQYNDEGDLELGNGDYDICPECAKLLPDPMDE